VPILKKQPSVYPPTLLKPAEVDPAIDLLRSEADEVARIWWVVYTRSRREKSLARSLYGKQVPFYLPLVSCEHIYSGRKVKSFVPLFSNYLFLCATEEERISALATNCVSRMLPVDDSPALIHDLLNIHRLIDAEAAMTIEQRLLPGRAVRIKNGAFLGIEGVIVERRGQNRLLVVINYIQQGISIAIEDFMVEPI